MTALMEAAEDGHVETVVALIRHGTNVNLNTYNYSVWVSYWSQHFK